MPFYVCFRGNYDNLAFLMKSAKRPFLLEDGEGKGWQCVDVGEEAQDAQELTDEVSRAHQAASKVRTKADEDDESRLIRYRCTDEAALRQYLLQQFPAKEKPAMTLTLEAVPVPLRRDESGAYRVGSSRVVLDIVVREFNRGGSPESIADAYDTLDVADLYAVAAYYLRHREEVDRYVQGRADEAKKVEAQIRAKQGDRGDLRAMLLARQEARKQEHAATVK